MNTTEDIQNLAEEILGETIGDDQFLMLANIVKDRVEGDRAWAFLQKLAQPSYASSITLPTDFREERKLVINDVELQRVRFDEQHLYDTGNYWYIDHASGTYHPKSGSGTVSLYYLKTTPEITSGVTPVWPSRFWGLIAYEVVVMIQAGMDADSEFSRMAIQNKRQADLIYSAMAFWDTQLQVKEQGGRQGVANTDHVVDLSMM